MNSKSMNKIKFSIVLCAVILNGCATEYIVDPQKPTAHIVFELNDKSLPKTTTRNYRIMAYEAPGCANGRMLGNKVFAGEGTNSIDSDITANETFMFEALYGGTIGATVINCAVRGYFTPEQDKKYKVKVNYAFVDKNSRCDGVVFDVSNSTPVIINASYPDLACEKFLGKVVMKNGHPYGGRYHLDVRVKSN